MSKIKKKDAEKGEYNGKGFVFLACVLLIVAIGIVAGKILFPVVTLDYYALGIQAKQNASYGEAYYYLNKSISSDPTLTEAYLNLSDILVAKSRTEEAIDLLESGVSRASDPSLIRSKLVLLYLDTDKYEDQQQNLLALLADRSSTESTSKYTYYLGLTYLRLLKLDEAKECFRQVLNEFPQTEWYYRSSLELSLYSIEDSITLNAMLGIASDAASPVMEDAAKLQEKLGKAKISKDRGDEGQMWGWYGVLMLEQDRCEHSEKYFLNGIEEGDKYGVHAGIHGYYSECLYRIQRYDDSLSQANIALKADPLLLSAWETKAKTCTTLQDYECADSAFSKLTKVSPSNTSYKYLYASYLLSLDREAEALSVLEGLFAIEEEANKRILAGRILDLMFWLGEGYDRAQNYIDVIDNGSSEYYDYLGWLLYLTDGTGQEELTTSLNIDPYNASACYHYAYTLYVNGDRKLSLEYAYKSIDYDLSGKIGRRANQLIEKVDNKT